MNFKKWVKSIQTAGYNGARTVDKKQTLSVIRVFFLIFCSSQFNSICLSDETYRECALVAIIGGKDFRPPFDG